MARGTLRIFLGAAPGVGKTFEMLQYGNRELHRGRDVVIGFLETHGRQPTADQIGDLEIIPRRTIEHRGATFSEMDVDAVLTRAPDVALVDEYAHTNIPGSRNTKRWQDIDELLDAGIDVVSTVNIQHLESLNDVVEQITGIKQRETVPDVRVRSADQIDLVDLPPESVRRRLARGLIYDASKIDAALGNFFRPGNLGALRELALLWLADRVDEALDQYKRDHDIGETWETRERVLVALTGAPNADHVIRRAARLAARTHGELVAVHVIPQDGLARTTGPHLEDQRALIEQLGGIYLEIVGDDPADALLATAHSEEITQLVLGATRRSRWQELIGGSVINRVIRGAGSVDVHVISSDGSDGEPLRLWRHPRHRALSRRRRLLGFAVGAVGTAALSAFLIPSQRGLELASVMLLYLGLTVIASAVGGLAAGLTTALAAIAITDYYFTDPLRTWVVADTRVVLALVVFVVVSGIVSLLVDIAARRAAEATRATAEAAALSDLARVLLDSDRPLEQLVDHIRTALQLHSITLLRSVTDGGWTTEASSGADPPTAPEEGSDTITIPPDHVLVLSGSRTVAEDRRVLTAFAAQLGVALESRTLARVAATAGELQQANELRAALLAAVSHDLRTPLAAMKAAATSLQQTDVHLTRADHDEFVQTIVEETDRLNRLVGNLLDMSRIHSGALDPITVPVGLDEIVPAAMRSLGDNQRRLDVSVPESLPRVHTDPGLLERIIANLLSNAVKWSPPGTAVRVVAGEIPSGVDLRVVDRGEGIAAGDRDRIFEPFQRIGDGHSSDGIGLGLAVARGFADAINASLTIDDTPGGGTTMVLHLPTTAESGETAAQHDTGTFHGATPPAPA
ncbi:MAG TPA: ATP-binding protein, partial [Euzebyales bacterium]